MSIYVKLSKKPQKLDLADEVREMLTVGYSGEVFRKQRFHPNEIEGSNHLLSGCYTTGWYEYGGYLRNYGAPDDWAGIMIVFARRYLHSGSPDYQPEGYIRIAFTCGCYIYMCICDETGATPGWYNVAKPV
nr:MAG TPA: hypothetical protein [Bacteriophage sp.]